MSGTDWAVGRLHEWLYHYVHKYTSVLQEIYVTNISQLYLLLHTWCVRIVLVPLGSCPLFKCRISAMHPNTHTYTHTHTHTHTCTHTRTHTHTHTHTQANVHTHMYTHTRAHMYTHTDTHTKHEVLLHVLATTLSHSI